MKNNETQNFKLVHRGIVHLSELECPEIVKDALDVLSKKHINVPKPAILNILNSHFGHLVMSKKVKLNYAGEIILPGQFGIVMLKSGTGKDYIKKDIQNYLFKKHSIWFAEKAEKLHSKLKEIFDKQQIEDRCKRTQMQQEIETQFTNKGGIENVSIESGRNPF